MKVGLQKQIKIEENLQSMKAKINNVLNEIKDTMKVGLQKQNKIEENLQSVEDETNNFRFEVSELSTNMRNMGLGWMSPWERVRMWWSQTRRNLVIRNSLGMR